MLSFYLSSVETDEEKSLVSRLYSEYKSMMYKIAVAVLKNSYDAEDAVHDAFMNIIRKDGLSKLKTYDKASEKAYIVVVTKNAAMKIYNMRKRTAAVNIDDFYSLESGDSPEKTLFVAYDVDCVGKALLKLSEKDYEILFLSLVNELSHREIAEYLEIREDAVRQRVHRAKLRLKKILDERDMEQ